MRTAWARMSGDWAAAFFAAGLTIGAAETASARQGSRYLPALTTASSDQGVVATVSPDAAEIAVEVLDAGGNAIDAAVAATFAVGVARPDMCGIGGGGFLVLRLKDGTVAALDFRELAPGAMGPNTIASYDGLPWAGTGHLYVGLPGVVAGLYEVFKNYSSYNLSWVELIEPAAILAEDGVAVTPELFNNMGAHRDRLAFFPATAAIYLKDGNPYLPGDILHQNDYAQSLRAVADGLLDAFYKVDHPAGIARAIVDDMANADPRSPGLITGAGMGAYVPKWRNAIQSHYGDLRIVGMPPPSSGGIAVAEILNILSNFGVGSTGFEQSSANHLHVYAEAQKLAFADRDAYVADSDFVSVPIAGLISSTYAQTRAQEIDMGRAKEHLPGDPEGFNTTHISVVDRQGNAVAVTCSLEQPFGSAVVAPGTGFLLNGQMGDFGPSGTPNEAQPYKRPRSSMSPTIVERPRGSNKTELAFVLGGSGGSTIIGGVVQAIVNVSTFGLNVAEAIDAERIDAISNLSYLAVPQNALSAGPVLFVEDTRVALGVLEDLQARGHAVQRVGEYGFHPILQAVGPYPFLSTSAGCTTGGVSSVLCPKWMAASDPRSEWGASGQ